VRDDPPPSSPGAGTRTSWRSVWVYDSQRVEITQRVDLVAGEQSGDLDTCLVRYRIENKDDEPHRIGLRFLLDTFIGANDGVPFLIPGASQLCDTDLVLRGGEIPQYLQACEREDLASPGTVARLLLRAGGGLEPPDRVTLGAWPNLRLPDARCKQEKTLWDVPVLPIKSLPEPDSAVTMYWDERLVPAGAKRDVGFAYGLGSLAGSEGGGHLAVSVGGSFTPGGDLTVTAYVKNPSPGQSVTLELPKGFALIDSRANQPVPPLSRETTSQNSPVAWRVRSADRSGEYDLAVRSSTGASQSTRVSIRNQGIFGG
jgi:hypothetical protein